MTGSLDQLPFIDLYLRLDQPSAPLYRCGDPGKGTYSQLVPDMLLPAVERLSVAVRAALQDKPKGTMNFENLRCRASIQRMVDGSVWACVRKINSQTPELKNLRFAPHIINHLHALGGRAGLILISGPAGHGKTTTGAGLLIDYLKSFGGTAFTLENPVEYVLMGRHGTFGQCFQVEVSDEDHWAPLLEQAMSWAPRYIFMGEVRTPKAAEQLLRAASNGHLVLTTVNGGMPEEALTSLLFLAEQAMGPGAKDVLSSCLTALLHQTMKEEGPFVRYLFTEENAPSDPIRTLIRENKIGMMSTYIDRIAARLANQPVPLAAHTGTGSHMSAAHHDLPPLPPIRKT